MTVYSPPAMKSIPIAQLETILAQHYKIRATRWFIEQQKRKKERDKL